MQVFFYVVSFGFLVFALYLFCHVRKKIEYYRRLEKSFDTIVDGLSKLDPNSPEEEFFQKILNIAMEVVPEAVKGSVSRITPSGDWIFVASRGHIVDLLGKRFPSRYLFRAGRDPVEVNFLDYDRDLFPDDMWKFFERTLRGTKKRLVVGIFSGDEFVGNIALDSPYSGFSELSKKVLKSLGNLASTYLLMRKTLANEQQLQKVMSTIFTLLFLFRKSISVEEFLKEALQKIVEASNVFTGGIVFEGNIPVFHTDLEEIPEFDFEESKEEEKIEKLVKDGVHYIVVHLDYKDMPSYHMVFLSNEDIAPSFFSVLNTFAEVVSLYLREYHLHQKYRELALKDPLTEAYSRHYFNEWIFSHMAWLRRNQKKSVLVIMDVDGLKMINDTYGHLMGDKALVEFVKTLKRTVRESDLVFRYGGDEFLLVLVDSTKDNAASVLKRVEENLKDVDLPFKIEFSFGYEEIDGFMPIERALARADDLLYKNKFEKRGGSE
ncbi:GGDEF domain-containing protein [Thermotoga sp. RQ2]|uniref:GGDEF domain-containing protein n=1 Tax=Thermotoga sp. (strain RQ2) TaxID=126740 RepID=UPI0001600BEF|nr:GGDEF domain-containing protein [Thermotoga sp. RQ2]ACB09987.1 diguanylate cyclase [Thermotoga sp. RQ2]